MARSLRRIVVGLAVPKNLTNLRIPLDVSLRGMAMLILNSVSVGWHPEQQRAQHQIK